MGRRKQRRRKDEKKEEEESSKNIAGENIAIRKEPSSHEDMRRRAGRETVGHMDLLRIYSCPCLGSLSSFPTQSSHNVSSYNYTVYNTVPCV